MSLVFSLAEFINVVLGIVGSEGLTRFLDRVTKSNGSMRNLAKRIARHSDGLIADRRAFVDLISAVAAWEALAGGDPMAFEPFAQRLAAVVKTGAGADEHRANCLKVAHVMAGELLSTLTAVERLQLKTYSNTTVLLGDVSQLTLSLGQRLDGFDRRLDGVLESLLPTRFAGLAGMSADLAKPVDRAVAAVVQMHREACSLAGEPDVWQVRQFDHTILKQMLGHLSRLFEPSPAPGERLLLHVVPLYVDAVLRIEAAERREAMAGNEIDQPQVIRADLQRARSALPGIVKKIEGDGGSPLVDWLAHQATLLSPSVWESWSAYRLAAAIAELVEEHEPYRGEVATFLRRLGRNAVYDAEEFRSRDWTIRLPSCTEPLTINEARTAALTRFAWQAIIDPRRVGLRLAEHVGMTGGFDLADALEDLHSAQWGVDGGRLELEAFCSHPAVAQALIEHASRFDQDLEDLRRRYDVPVRRELRVGSARVRPKSRANGQPMFELPLIQLEMSQEEMRQLLMGTALYGRPELAIREMYQNALDACRHRGVRHRFLKRNDPGVRDYAPRIEISQGPQPQGGVVIECLDNGVGMSYVELRGAFAQAGKRFTDLASFQDEQARWSAQDPNLRLYPNSRFGIGVFSYFMLTDEVEVTTVRQREDGSLGRALHVHISALSGLLTVSELASRPPRLAEGGTLVRLVIPAGTGADHEALRVSALDLLEDLVWYTETELVVAEQGRLKRTWRPGELAEPMATISMLAFGKQECRGWWTNGRGAVLADGIKTDVELPGLIVDLRGPHRPLLRADRNQVLEWKRRWAIGQFTAAADGVVDWPELNLAWIWRVAIRWPRLGDRLTRTVESKGLPIPVGVEGKAGVRVDIGASGCLPADEAVLGARTIASPFAPPPELIADPGGGMRRSSWPSSTWDWRRSRWAELLGPDAGEEIDLDGPDRFYAPASGEGYPVPTAIEAALLCGLQSHGYSTYGRAELGALVAGAARAEIRLADAVKAIRRYHINAVVLPEVDARAVGSVHLGGEIVEQVLSAAEVLRRSNRQLSGLEVWVGAALASAHHSRLPLRSIWHLFRAMAGLGEVDLPSLPSELADRVPTRREAELLVDTNGVSLVAILNRAEWLGTRNPSDIVRLLRPYEELLREVGVDLAVIERLAAGQPTGQAKVAWSTTADGRPPWLYGQKVSYLHLIRVAYRLGITVAAARDLVQNCPGVHGLEPFAAAPEILLEERDYRLIADWLGRRSPPANAWVIAQLAGKHGFEPQEAIDRLRVLHAADVSIEGIDWAAVRAFSPTLAQRELWAGQRISRRALVGCAVKLQIGVSEVMREALPLRAIGIECAFPPAPSPFERPATADLYLVSRLESRGGRHAMSLIAESVGMVPETVASRLDRVLAWARWLWSEDEDLQRILAVADKLREHLVGGPFDEIAATALQTLERIAARTGSRIHRAHLIELAGNLGVTLSRLRLALEPFAEMMACLGWTVPWFDDPLGTPPDWLDVGVISLIVAWGDACTWDERVADFLAGNIDAPVEEIRRRWQRWAGLLSGDPNGLPTMRYSKDIDCTGMFAWERSPAAR